MRRRISVVLLLFLLGLPSYTGSEETASKQSNLSHRDKLDISAVTLLLDVLDLLVRKNSDYRTTLADLSKTPPGSAESELQRLANKNMEDPEIKGAIQKLQDSPTYQLYYRKFRNVTPETHCQVLCALPYKAIRSPGDIASSLRELCLNRDSVRTWVAHVISRIDLEKSHQIALQWLPPGEYTSPVTHFFYDGNGDAFALDDEVGFDLYGTIFGRCPPETRFANLGEVGIERIEMILAHELYHVHGARYLYPPGRAYASWRDQWKDRLIRQFVNEGVAMQCDVRPSFRRTLMEDSTIVRYWIGQLNEKLAALRTDSITEPQMQAWFDSSFQETPQRLMEEYRKRVSPTADSAAFMEQNQVNRPMMIYTLGWWMMGRVSQTGKKRESVIRSLGKPYELVGVYNETLAGMNNAFRVIVTE